VLDEKYLQTLAKEIKGRYVRGDSIPAVLGAIREQPPARRDRAPFAIDWLLAALAGVLLVAAYLPHHPLKLFRRLRARLQFSAGKA
jgi:mxaL protein